MPEIEELKYEKKDDKGQVVEQKLVNYGFEYSPCEYSKDDVLHLKIHGIEGKADYQIKVSFLNSAHYQTICPEGKIKPQDTIDHTLTPVSDYYLKFGGVSLLGEVASNKLFLLDNKLNWKTLTPHSKIPSPRFGHSAFEFEQYFIVLGGEDATKNKLNDVWAYNIETNIWIEVVQNGKTKVPRKKSHVSSCKLENHGAIAFFGGVVDSHVEDRDLALLSLSVLKQLIRFVEGSAEIEYSKVVNRLWKSKTLDIPSRRGHSLREEGGKIYMFGGYDHNNNMVNGVDIIDLEDYSVQSISSSPGWPKARAFHGTLNYGSILVMYGGELSSGEVLNDMWKFDVQRLKWFKVEESKANEFYLYRKNFDLLLWKGQPLIYGGFTRNNEHIEEFIAFNFDTCSSDIQTLSADPCLPCSKGTALTRRNTCLQCSKGFYHSYSMEEYANSTCEACPKGTYNNSISADSRASCLICPYGTFANSSGMARCVECTKDQICLPGCSKPLYNQELQDKIEKKHIKEVNYPNFMMSKTKEESVWKHFATVLISSMVAMLSLIFLVVYILKSDKFTRVMVNSDFLPITGGTVRRCSGGVLTYLYIILVTSLSITFLIRYLYFNHLIEVLPLSYSKNKQTLEASYRVNINLIGYSGECVNREKFVSQDRFECHSDLQFELKDLNLVRKSQKLKSVHCSVDSDGFCKISVECLNCREFKNNSAIQLKMNKKSAVVKLYEWEFESYWSEDFNYRKGYSKAEGLFFPDEDTQ